MAPHPAGSLASPAAQCGQRPQEGKVGVKGVVLTPQGPGAHSSSSGESWEAARGPSLGLCPGDTRHFCTSCSSV